MSIIPINHYGPDDADYALGLYCMRARGFRLIRHPQSIVAEMLEKVCDVEVQIRRLEHE
jgi:hypothetical protein